MSDDLTRAYARIFNAARGAGLALGPVMGPSDFERFPEVLADVVEDAVDRIPEDTAERPRFSVDTLRDIAVDLRDALDQVETALEVAEAKRADATAKGGS